MTAADAPPPALRTAAAVVGVESVAAVAAGVGFLVAAVVGKPSDRAVAVTLAVLLLVFGAGLGLVARGLWRCRPAARPRWWSSLPDTSC